MCALTLGVPLRAEAQSRMTATARTYYENGSRAFAEGRHQEAAQAFQEAFNLSHQPELLFNLARALEAQGDRAGAVDALVLFRNAGAPGFDRATLDQQLAALRAAIEEERARPTPQPTPAVPGADPAAPPVVRTVERTVIQPAWYRVEYRRSTLSNVGPWVLLGLGGAVGVLALVQGLVARGDINTLNDANSGAVRWSSAAQEANDRVGGEVSRAYVFAGVGGALAVGGALWLLLRGPGQRNIVNTPPALTLLPHGVGITFGGTL